MNDKDELELYSKTLAKLCEVFEVPPTALVATVQDTDIDALRLTLYERLLVIRANQKEEYQR